MLAYLKDLSEGRRSSIQDLDKSTLTLASAAFALSIAVAQALPKPLLMIGTLQTAWWLILSSVGSTVLSLTLGTCSHWYLNHAVRRAYIEKRDWHKCRAPWIRYPTRVFTVLGPVLFFIGMIHLAIFSLHNLEVVSEQKARTTGATKADTTAAAPTPPAAAAPTPSATSATTPSPAAAERR